MFSGPPCQAGDGVAVNAEQAADLPGAVALTKVIEHGTGLLLGQMGSKECRTFTFGEAILAGPAVEQADLVLLAEAAAEGKVTGAPQTVEFAVGGHAAKTRQVVHGSEGLGWCPRVKVWK
jgi:hypothetical protein